MIARGSNRIEPAARPRPPRVHDLARRAVRLASIVLLPVLGACEFVTGVDMPDELRLRLEADTDQVTLVTSAFFVLVPNAECDPDCTTGVQLVQADTTVVSVPFERTYAFTQRQQYYVEAWPSSGGATITMTVHIDGKVWYDDFRELVPTDPDDPETIRFVYNFQELIF